MSEPVKLPKHVAGVKIPKPLRHAVEALLDHAASAAGRRLLAGALIAAAAALTRDLYLAEDEAEEPVSAEKPSPPRMPWEGTKPALDMGALLGMATTVIGGLRAAGERKVDTGPAPTKPGEV